MTHLRPIFGSAVLGMFFTAHGAWAGVTPNDVWQDWRDYMQGMGYKLTATEDSKDTTLAVSNIQFDFAADADQGQMSLSLETLNFVQNGDGSVSVVMPAVMPIVVEITPAGPDAKAIRMALSINQNGYDMKVTGDPADMTSTYSAGALGLNLDQLTVGDESYGAQNALLNVAMMDVRNTTTSRLGNMRSYDQNATVASVTYNMRFKNPDEPALAVIEGTTKNLKMASDGVLPLGLAQVSDMAGMLRAGMDASGKITGGNSTVTLNIEDPANGDVAVAAATESSTLTVETSADGLSYAGTRQGTAVSVQSPELPAALSFAIDNAAFNLSAPVTKSPDPQNFALGLNMDGLALSDPTWGLIDPQGALPRDPANLTLDLSGKLTLLMDYFDPQTAESMANSGTLPGQLDMFQLNSLIIEALGAKLTGNGTVNFDNATSEPDPGTLKPVGAVDLKLTGGSALLDTLVASGLVPAQTAMGARMILGIFAVPDAAQDTLKSRLEFTRDGSILANGQRIK